MKPLAPIDGDAPVTIDLDTAWLGVNERDDPAGLATAEGSYVRSAINTRFRTRRPETRPGYLTVAGMSYVADYGMNSGAGTYVDAAGVEWTLSAQYGEENGVLDPRRVVAVFMRHGTGVRLTFSTLAYSAERSWFTQAGTDLILWRMSAGEALEPLIWTGGTEDLWTTVEECEAPGYAEYLRPLPKAAFGIYKADRVIFPYADGIGYTDLLAPRRWDPDLQTIPVEGGGRVTGLAWLRRSLIVFKETSVTALVNFAGDLTAVEREDVSTQAGCISHATIVEAGGDLIWLGRGGVYRLSEAAAPGNEGAITVKRSLTPVPVSWPIPKTMERINWAAAHLACAVLADGLYYLSVPVDGSAVNNALFVYDTVMGTWQGEDRLTAHNHPGITAMSRARVFGRESVVVMSQSDIYVGGHGWHDGFGAGDIYTGIRFRGYALDDAGLKTLQRLEVQTEELGTYPALYANADGLRTDQRIHAPAARSPLRWLSFATAARDLTNADDDAGAVNREDYTWTVGDEAQCGDSGIPLGNMQRHKLAGMVRGAQMWVCPGISSARGRLRVCAVRASGIKRRDYARRT